MRKLVIILTVCFFVTVGGGFFSSCSNSTDANQGVATSRKSRCTTTKPSAVGFLYWVDCGFGRK